MTMNLVQNQEYFNIRYQIKPFMIWIWFSVLLIGFSGLISLVKKEMKIKIFSIFCYFFFNYIFNVL